MTKSTRKILQLDWKTPGFFSFKRLGTLRIIEYYLRKRSEEEYRDVTGCMHDPRGSTPRKL